MFVPVLPFPIGFEYFAIFLFVFLEVRWNASNRKCFLIHSMQALRIRMASSLWPPMILCRSIWAFTHRSITTPKLCSCWLEWQTPQRMGETNVKTTKRTCAQKTLIIRETDPKVTNFYRFNSYHNSVRLYPRIHFPQIYSLSYFN